MANGIDGRRRSLPEGMILVESSHGPEETVDRLIAAVSERGMQVMARIDHAAGASEAGLELRPTVVLLFGNARAGTPLMQASELIGLDLPLRLLVSQRDDGTTFAAYTEPGWLAARYGLAAMPVLTAMADALSAVTTQATRG